MQPMQFKYIENNDKQNGSNFDLIKYNNLFNDESKKEYLGEIIYDQVFNSPLINDKSEKDKVAGKITGMILGIGNNEEIIRICTDNESLNRNITEALNLLNSSNYDYNS